MRIYDDFTFPLRNYRMSNIIQTQTSPNHHSISMIRLYIVLSFIRTDLANHQKAYNSSENVQLQNESS